MSSQFSYKQTIIGKIPEDWEIRNLKDIVELCENGIWGDEPLATESSYPVIRSTEITYDGKIDLSKVAYRKIPKEIIERYLLKDGDILIVGSSGSTHLIGRAALFINPDNRKYLFSNFLIRIRPKEVHPHFLYYFLNSNYYFLFLKRLQQTSTGLRNLPKKELLKLKIPIPPLPEQKAIAQILSTVDKAIQKVDEIIAKTERLKKGLMQKLLTKGIGHKEFKDTEIGQIPKEWEIIKLKEITTKIKDIDHKMPKKEEIGVPFVSIKYMLKYPDLNFYLDPNDPDLEFISKEEYEYHVQRFNVEKGDIIYSRFGSIGNAKLVMTDQPFIASYSIVLIKPDRRKVDSIFLTCVLNSERVRKQAKSATKGATNRNLHLEDIKNFRIPLPPLSEQQKIAEILSTIDKKLELERKRKEKLERIKKGLMNELLTGKKRVNFKKLLKVI
jgi:type I restriction enzyme S subunit